MPETQYSYLAEIQKIAARQKAEVYLVGGFLRDHLLGRDCLDFDFAVQKGGLKLARSFAKKIKGAFIVLDEERNCARVAKKIEGDILTFDFADYRAATIRGDLNHRDFTINALALRLDELISGEKWERSLLNITKAKSDLKAKRICMVSAKSFKEDPLRLMRAFSLKAVLGFKIERTTLAQIRKDVDLIRKVSPERVREELFKVLASERSAQILKDMDTIGLLVKVMPQIAVMFGVKQGTYHHLDVWPHSLETVLQLEKVLGEFAGGADISEYLETEVGGGHTRRQVLKLGALLHDIGKPETRKREKDRISFHGHEHVGRSIVRHIANQLKFSTKERHMLEDLVRWHLRPGYLSNFKKPSDRAVYRYFRDTGDEGVGILLLSMADQRATCGPATTEYDQKHHAKICRDLLKRYFTKAKEKPIIRLLSGDDLIKSLKLTPSPLFAEILNDIEEQQALGKLTTKDEALKRARALADLKRN